MSTDWGQNKPIETTRLEPGDDIFTEYDFVFIMQRLQPTQLYGEKRRRKKEEVKTKRERERDLI